jgi:hypothetical protein
MILDLKKVYAPDTIQVFQNIPAKDLTHEYSDERKNSKGHQIPFDDITGILGELGVDVEEWYASEFGELIDTYNLGKRRQQVLDKFHKDPRFKQAFELLELDFQYHPLASIPWWNEVAAGELDYSASQRGVHLVLGPRHSLETQLMRGGIERPVKNVSVGSMILTTEDNGNDFLVLGLRGGASYPNTFHINAGALRVDDEFKQGFTSVYEVFKEHELKKEFGLTEDDLISATLHSRTFDRVIDQGPMYNFLLQTNLDREELFSRWTENLDSDKDEHNSLRFVQASPWAVNQFIQNTYKGVVENKQDRAYIEKQLLHPGALALASFSGMSIDELKGLYQEGSW